MAHLVVIPGPVTSKLISTMELCRRLREAGHHVTVVAPAAPKIVAAGIEYVAFDLELPRLERPAPGERGLTRHARARWQSWRSRGRRREAAVAAMDVEGFRALVISLAPDLLLIDIEAHVYTMAAAATGVPTALVNIFFNLHKRPGAPPLHVPITPGIGVSGSRLWIELAWLRFRAWRWLVQLRSRLDGTDYFALIEAYAARADYSLDRNVDRYQALLPFVYRHLPMLTLNLAELELPGARRQSSHYVGPMTSVDRSDFSFTEDERSIARELTALADEVEASAGRAKLIYCSFGSYFMGDDREFLNRVAEAVASRPEWTAVIALGGRMEPGAIAPLPPNVRAFRWAPQMQVLARADCALIHGGMTSVYEAIHCEVPMVLFPFPEIFDQFGTASRARYHGIGVVGDRRRDSSEAIRGHIERALSDESIRANVTRMNEHMRRYRREHLAARAVDEIIAGDAGARMS